MSLERKRTALRAGESAPIAMPFRPLFPPDERDKLAKRFSGEAALLSHGELSLSIAVQIWNVVTLSQTALRLVCGLLIVSAHDCLSCSSYAADLPSVS
jgi:hypothetical protein